MAIPQYCSIDTSVLTPQYCSISVFHVSTFFLISYSINYCNNNSMFISLSLFHFTFEKIRFVVSERSLEPTPSL